jgi:hypothetical protein
MTFSNFVRVHSLPLSYFATRLRFCCFHLLLSCTCRFLQFEFTVGYGDQDYPGYRKMTKLDLLDREMRQQLLDSHAQRGGWALAQPIVEVKDVLCVANGFVQIDKSTVTVVGQVFRQALSIRGVYAAVTRKTKVAWTNTPPLLDGTWSVFPWNIGSSPCLFVRSLVRYASSLSRVLP